MEIIILVLRRERDAELGGELLNRLVAQLRAVATLERRKRGLLTADFGRKLRLRNTRLSPGQRNLLTKLSGKSLHNNGPIFYYL